MKRSYSSSYDNLHDIYYRHQSNPYHYIIKRCIFTSFATYRQQIVKVTIIVFFPKTVALMGGKIRFSHLTGLWLIHFAFNLSSALYIVKLIQIIDIKIDHAAEIPKAEGILLEPHSLINEQ